MFYNVGINSVNDKFNDMDRLHEIIGHLTDEEYDAVLYGVMLRLIKRKEKEHKITRARLMISVADEDNPTLSLSELSRDSMEMIPVELIKLNEA